MKKFIFLQLVFLPIISSAQNYNPFLVQGIISPSPLLPKEAGGTGDAAWIVGNSGGTPLPLVANQEMKLTIVFKGGVPNVADANNAMQAIASITGNFASYFNWSYLPAARTFIGTQNKTIPGFSFNPLDPVSAGNIVIPYKVAENTGISAPDNGFSVSITPPPYANESNAPDDDFLSSYTWTSFHVSGNVFNDGNGVLNGLIDGTPTDGTPVSVSGSLYVSLVNAYNAVLTTVAVEDDGTYQFFSASDGQFKVVLHTNPAGSATSANLPNWVNTAEGINHLSDGQANGILAIVFTNSKIEHANFGINQLPETENLTVSLKGQVNVLDKMPLRGSDPEDGSQPGSLSVGYNFVITALPANARLLYNNVFITAAHVASGTGTARINNYDPASLAIRFLNKPKPGEVATFKYAAIDKAGIPDTSPAIYLVKIVKTLPTEPIVNAELEGVMVYPNPVLDKMNVVFTEAGLYNLLLSDANGKRIIYKQVDIGKGSYNAIIPRGALPAGMYLLQVFTVGKAGTKNIKLLFAQR